MNFLHGMMDIPSHWMDTKAILELTEEYQNEYSLPIGDDYLEDGMIYRAVFKLNKPFSVKVTGTDHAWQNGAFGAIDVSCGRIVLKASERCVYARQIPNKHDIRQVISILGSYPKCPVLGTKVLSVKSILWREGISLTENLWNEKVEKFRQAFLNDDPIVHDQIQAAILEVMENPQLSKI